MQRWRTLIGGLALCFGLLAYLIACIWLIERAPAGTFWRWALYIGLSLVWIWPALKVSRWTLRDPGTRIEDLR